MEKTVTFEMTESQAEKFEKLLDATLEILTRKEKESPEREARITQIQAETNEIKKDIKKQLTLLNKRNERLSLA